jgi:hypothetical protein
MVFLCFDISRLSRPGWMHCLARLTGAVGRRQSLANEVHTPTKQTADGGYEEK